MTTPHAGGRPGLYYQFWSGLLPKLHRVQPQWSRTKAPGRNHMRFESASPCVKYLPSFRRHGRLIAQAYIDCKDDATVESIFTHLHERRGDIEESFGGELGWDPGSGVRYASVYTDFPGEISIEDSDRWPDAQEWLVSTLSSLRDVIDPEIDAL